MGKFKIRDIVKYKKEFINLASGVDKYLIVEEWNWGYTSYPLSPEYFLIPYTKENALLTREELFQDYNPKIRLVGERYIELANYIDEKDFERYCNE